MKYESYIRSLARYIRSEADQMKDYAEAKEDKEKSLQKASFIEAMTNIIFSLGSYNVFNFCARRIAETAEYLNAPKSFVERQPRGMTAFQIGAAWIKRQREAKK